MKPHIYCGPFGWDVRVIPPFHAANTMRAHEHARKLNNTYPWNVRRHEEMVKGLDAIVKPWLAGVGARAGGV